MKLLVCGGRDYTDIFNIYRVLEQVCNNHDITEIIEGDASGVDRIAGRWAVGHGRKLTRFPADWERYGKAAGPIRNSQMLDEGRPDICLHFPGGKGTEDMVRQARKAGLTMIDASTI
jgi:hypothetical protein